MNISVKNRINKSYKEKDVYIQKGAIMLKRIRKHSIIQAVIFAVLAFSASIPLFPETTIAAKLFMFFMGIGCGVSLSGYLMLLKNKNTKR